MRKYLSIFLCVLTLAVGSYFVIDNRDDTIRVDSKKGGMKWSLASDEAQQKYFDQLKKRQDFYSSESEVNKVLPFKIKLPKTSGAGLPQAIYTTKEKKPDIVNIKVFYGNGYDDLNMEIRKAQGEINYEQIVKEFEENKKAGIGKYDKLPQVISVNGIEGWGSESGYNIVDGQKYPMPGFVSWRDNGVEYMIYGIKGENGHSLQQLIKIANSIYE